MLVRFAVENFLSFRNLSEFKMSASDSKRHNSHFITRHNRKILKSALIYGANASGKTNFIKAIDFAKKIIIQGLSTAALSQKYFRINSEYASKPGFFQFDFYSKKRFYSYGFVISYKHSTIEEEWLYDTTENDKCIFIRTRSNGVSKIETEIEFKNENDRNRFSVYASDICNDNMKETFFLTDVALRTSQNTAFKPFQDVLSWFNKLYIIFPYSRFKHIHELIEQPKRQEKITHALKYFDTGILEITTGKVDIDKLFNDMSATEKEHLLEDIAKLLRSKNSKKGAIHKYSIPSAGDRIQFYYLNGTLHAEKILTNHGNIRELFSYKDESDGTKRLFDLLPILEILGNSVVFVDEIDRSLHTKLIMEFYNMFYNECKNREIQLIATTHDSNLLDLNLVRQDEIWFVERDTTNGSNLFSLDKYKIAFNNNIEKDYLVGRYGAIPIFDYSEQSQCVSDDYDNQ